MAVSSCLSDSFEPGPVVNLEIADRLDLVSRELADLAGLTREDAEAMAREYSDALTEAQRHQDVIDLILDFADWDSCGCSDCRTWVGSHGVDTRTSMQTLADLVRARLAEP